MVIQLVLYVSFSKRISELERYTKDHDRYTEFQEVAFGVVEKELKIKLNERVCTVYRKRIADKAKWALDKLEQAAVVGTALLDTEDYKNSK